MLCYFELPINGPKNCYKNQKKISCPYFTKFEFKSHNSEEIIGVIFSTAASPLHLKLDTNDDDHH